MTPEEKALLEDRVKTLTGVVTDIEQLIYEIAERMFEEGLLPMPRKVKAVTIPDDLGQRIKQWNDLATWLSTGKDNEHALRQALVNDVGFAPEKLEGAESLDIGYGYRLKATKVQNYTATNENSVMEQLLAALAAIDPALPLGFVTRWVPEISTKYYRETILPIAEKHEHLKPLLSAAITVKPGMPTLELIPPKTETVEQPTPAGGTLVTDGAQVNW